MSDPLTAADLENVPRLVAEVRRLTAAVDAIRALHRRRPWRLGDFVTFGQTEFPDLCDHCRSTWPCSTVRLLDKHLTTEDGR